MGKIIFVSGGVSSGKSSFAEEIVSKKNKKTLYLATSLPLDDEMQEKKRKHIERRAAKNWDTLEKYDKLYSDIGEIAQKYDLVLLDCLTMLLSNLIFHEDYNFDAQDLVLSEEKSKKIIREMELLIEEIQKNDLEVVVVTNEIGLGGISENRLGRYFSQLCGQVNQMFAKASQQAYLIVSSIAVKIK